MEKQRFTNLSRGQVYCAPAKQIWYKLSKANVQTAFDKNYFMPYVNRRILILGLSRPTANYPKKNNVKFIK